MRKTDLQKQEAIFKDIVDFVKETEFNFSDINSQKLWDVSEELIKVRLNNN